MKGDGGALSGVGEWLISIGDCGNHPTGACDRGALAPFQTRDKGMCSLVVGDGVAGRRNRKQCVGTAVAPWSLLQEQGGTSSRRQRRCRIQRRRENFHVLVLGEEAFEVEVEVEIDVTVTVIVVSIVVTAAVAAFVLVVAAQQSQQRGRSCTKDRSP